MWKKELEIAKLAAVKAGEAIMKIYNSADFGIEYKKDDSPLTVADKASNEIIVKILRENFSSYAILSEEEKEVYLMPDEDLEGVNASVLLSTSKSMISAMNTNAEYQHNMRARLASLRVAEVSVDSDDVDDLF